MQISAHFSFAYMTKSHFSSSKMWYNTNWFNQKYKSCRDAYEKDHLFITRSIVVNSKSKSFMIWTYRNSSSKYVTSSSPRARPGAFTLICRRLPLKILRNQECRICSSHHGQTKACCHVISLLKKKRVSCAVRNTLTNPPILKTSNFTITFLELTGSKFAVTYTMKEVWDIKQSFKYPVPTTNTIITAPDPVILSDFDKRNRRWGLHKSTCIPNRK